MNKLYSYTTIFLIGSWILIIYYVQNNLSTYSVPRYENLILGSAYICLLVGGTGSILDILKRKRSLNFIFDYKKLYLLLILIGLGIFVNPIFFIISILIIFLKIKNDKTDELFRSSNIARLFIITIILTGVVFQSKGITSATADQRFTNFNSVDIQGSKSITNSFGADSSNYNIGDWVTSLSYNPDLSFYKDKSVEIIGFIFQPEEMKDKNDEFIVGRFVIRCCAADGVPVGLKVKYEWKDKFRENDWVNVKGRFEIINNNGVDELYIIPGIVEITEIPDQPYLV